jgi:hypothetical protein
MKMDFDKYHNLALEAKERLRIKNIEKEKEQEIIDKETERIRVEKLKLKVKKSFDNLPKLCEEAASRGQLYCTLFTVDGERRYNMEKCEFLNGLIDYAKKTIFHIQLMKNMYTMRVTTTMTHIYHPVTITGLSLRLNFNL